MTASSLLASVLLVTSFSAPAVAQFSLFGQSEASPQDVYGTIASHGFRMVGPLFRNGRVYVADVLDRRQRRERLIIAADSGQIVQRFFVDVGGAGRRTLEAAPADEQRRVSRNDPGDFFSRLAHGWGDDAPPRPPLGLDNQDDGDAVMPTPLPAPRVARPRPEPRVVTRTEEPPITSSPLPPPGSAKPAEKPPSSPVATAPADAAPAATSGRPTTVVLDPLRIPGQRGPTPPKTTPAPATVAATKPADPTPAVVTKPALAKPSAPADVPVAPLD